MQDKKNEYGSCCICETSTLDVRNIIQLDYKVKSESAWGCFKCGLPAEGAVAIVCDACIEKHGDDTEKHIRFLMDSAERRIPVPPEEERVPHEHDLSYHVDELFYEKLLSPEQPTR